ncbi:hypothetical protein KP509_03G052900 [Ceratopteris richardii]|uniref:Dirigent protein n=1 Tax=Ceratopteris richardii TaxID=49495 RepID=A0A8T2V2Y3_CERRI|nr:hypothetical protein KP509_03G052900 [Ceratopteris richardii]
MAAVLTRIDPSASMMILALVSGLLIHHASQNAVAVDSGSSCNSDSAKWPGPPPFRECRLQYYVQVVVGDVSLNQNLLPPLNQSYSGPFGHAELFAFNATDKPEQASTRIGFVELISYDDGKYKGTIQIQGEIRAISPNEVAIVGGTGSFRGARGFGFIERVLFDGPYRRFHLDLHFIYN